MKLAVIGAGSTYTPELVDGLVRMRPLLPVDDLALMDTDARRLEILGAVTRRMLDRGGHPARLRGTTSLDEAVEGADAVLVQLRVGGQGRGAHGRRVAAAPLRLHRPGDDRVRGAREGAADGSGGARDRRPRARARSGLLDRRLHESRRDRHQGAPRRRPPRGRALQCREGVPAPLREGARLGAGDRRARPRRPQSPDVGARRARGRQGRARAADRRARRAGGAGDGPARRPRPPARRRAVLLPALLLRPRRSCRVPPDARVAGRGGRADRARAARPVRRRVPRREAGAPLTARRRVLLGGGGAGGAERSAEVVAALVAEAGVATPADVGAFLLCGADVPSDIADLEAALDRHVLVRRVIVDNDTFAVWIPDARDPGAYDGRIAKAGGIDLFLLASGASDGHVAMLGPGAPRDGRTARVRLAESTRRDNLVTFPRFRSLDEVPAEGVSVGLATIAEADAARMVLVGADKREAARRLLALDRFDPSWPASIVHDCADAEIWLTEEARR